MLSILSCILAGGACYLVGKLSEKVSTLQRDIDVMWEHLNMTNNSEV